MAVGPHTCGHQAPGQKSHRDLNFSSREVAARTAPVYLLRDGGGAPPAKGQACPLHTHSQTPWSQPERGRGLPGGCGVVRVCSVSVCRASTETQTGLARSHGRVATAPALHRAQKTGTEENSTPVTQYGILGTSAGRLSDQEAPLPPGKKGINVYVCGRF